MDAKGKLDGASLAIIDGDELLNEEAAAKILGTATGTLQVWRSTKRYPLPYVKIGRSVRYRRSAISAFITSRTVAA
jgi:predicted DNA-binding transcriptional regulator AlpA